MTEEWRDIEGYEGIYQVSNLGRVRSVERIGTRPNPRTGKDMAYPMKSRVITPKNHPSGYQQVALYKDGKQSFLVHRLVADAFVDGYFDGAVVNHIDEDKLTIEDYPEWVGGWAWVFWYLKIGLLTIGTIYVAYRFVSPLFDL